MNLLYSIRYSPVFGKIVKRNNDGPAISSKAHLKKNGLQAFGASANTTKDTDRKRNSQIKERRENALHRLMKKRQKRSETVSPVTVSESEDEAESQRLRHVTCISESEESDTELESFLNEKPASVYRSSSRKHKNEDSSSDIDDDELDNLVTVPHRGKTTNNKKYNDLNAFGEQHDLPSSNQNKLTKMASKVSKDTRTREALYEARRKCLDGLISSDSEIDSDEDFHLTLSSAHQKAGSEEGENKSSPESTLGHLGHSKNKTNNRLVHKIKNETHSFLKCNKEKNNSKIRDTGCTEKADNVLAAEKNKHKFNFKSKIKKPKAQRLTSPLDLNNYPQEIESEQRIKDIRSHKFSFMKKSNAEPRDTYEADYVIPTMPDCAGTAERVENRQACQNEEINAQNDNMYNCDLNDGYISDSELMDVVVDQLDPSESHLDVIEITDTPGILHGPIDQTRFKSTNHLLEGFTSASKFYADSRQTKEKKTKKSRSSVENRDSRTKISGASLMNNQMACSDVQDNQSSMSWLDQPFPNSVRRNRKKTPKRSVVSISGMY